MGRGGFLLFLLFRLFLGFFLATVSPTPNQEQRGQRRPPDGSADRSMT
jgi:hypothetical protein